MDQSQRTKIEKRLQEERERAIKAMRLLDDSANEDDGGLTNYPLHLADEGTDSMEQEKSLLLLSQEGRRLHEIDEALRRLYRDPESFGNCERCGKPIPVERLELLPWTSFCMDCQELVEDSATEPRTGDVVEDEARSS